MVVMRYINNKFLLAISIVFLHSNNCLSQLNNLVPNSGFENINFDRWNDFYNTYQHCEHWLSPNEATPDVNYELINTLNLNKPFDRILLINLNQNLCAKSGLCYGGLVLNVITPTFKDTLNNRYSEYLQVKLKSKLKKGKLYYIGFYTNYASNYIKDGLIPNSIGIYLSDTAFFQRNSHTINLNPQILSTSEDILIDSINYRRIDGYYFAKGTEECITIGNFNKLEYSSARFSPNVKIKVNSTGDSTFFVSNQLVEAIFSYVNIDDVFVYEVPENNIAFQDSVCIIKEKENSIADKLFRIHNKSVMRLDADSIELNDSFKLNKLRFLYGSEQISKIGIQELKKIADFMRKNRNLILEIMPQPPEGEISKIDRDLILKRQKKIADQIRIFGVSPDRISLPDVKWFSKKNIKPNCMPEICTEYYFKIKTR